MVNENINKSITEAREYLEQIDQIGILALNVADGILNNNKAFVHDETIKKKIFDYENRIYGEFQKKIADARKNLEGTDPLFNWNDSMNYYMNMRLWKTQEMLSFWDEINKKHDL